MARKGTVPPSTLAAQILRSKASTQADNNFDQLLKDFLSDPVVDSGKLQENARFVTSLAEAVSEYRLKNEPFTPNQGKEQAVNCFKAIQITIERQPEILLFNGDDCSKSGSQPPLLLWMVTKILSIAAKESLTGLWNQLIDIMTALHRFSSQGQGALSSGYSMQVLIRDTVEGLMRFLEACINDQEEHNDGLATSFPSLDMLHQFWQPAEQSIALPPGNQITVNKPNDACSIVLLLVLSRLEINLGELVRNHRGMQLTISWALDISHRIVTSYWRLAKHRCIDRRKVVACISKILFKISDDKLATYNIQPWSDLIAQAISLLGPSDTEEVQINLARSIVAIQERTTVEQAGERITSSLTSALIRLMNNSSSWSKMTVDFQNAVKLYMLYVGDKCPLPPEIEGLLSMSELDKAQPFMAEILQETIRVSSNSKRHLIMTENEQERSSKRQKITDVDQSYERKEAGILTRELLSLLKKPSHMGINDLQDITQEYLANMKDIDAVALCDALRHLPCAGSKCLKLRSLKFSASRYCTLCDALTDQSSSTQKAAFCHYEPLDCHRVYEFLCLLVESSLVRNSRKLRILLVQSIRRFINHVIDEKYMSLSTDPLGRYCMKSLQSSTRELRLSASQAVMSYLREEIPKHTRYRNRSTTFELLKILNTRNNLPLKETLIATWGLVGRIGGEDELNLALIELVNALGDPHPILCGAAFHELRQLAKILNTEPIDLFSPFWRSIAPGLVKDVLSRPQKVQQLSDLLGLRGGVDELLVMTQSDTVPFLVVTKEHDVLQRIAQARAVTGIQELIMGSSRTLANVLAKLLLECSNSERVAESLLQETVPNLKGRFVEVVRLEAIMTACEILKAAGEMDNPKKATQAFELLAQLCIKGGSGHKDTDIDAAISEFVGHGGLGIMAHFTDIVEHSKDRLPLSEKRRALKAIEQFIKIAGANVEASLAQVRATLQSAFETTPLVNEAFSAWVELLNSVDEKRVGQLIHHTFSIVAHKWNTFNVQTQSQAKLVLDGMMDGHWTEILANIAILPDLCSITELRHIGNVIKDEKTGLHLHIHLHAFAQRCKDDHIIVVRHALQELKEFLEEFQEGVHESANGPQPLPAISELYRSLLDVIIRFKEQDERIVDLSTQCLGILGCVDPNQVDTVREKHALLVLSNFDDVPEVVDFIAHMLETVLVEAFRSAPNGRQQSYFAFVMQELLKLSRIRDALTQRARSSPPKVALARWSTIPESIRNTLTPYLNSKYSLTNPSASTELVPFPLSGQPPNHAVWLRQFVFHLLHRGKGSIAEKMFPVISRVIHSHDLSVASFMVPFAVQNVVAGGEGYEIDFIKEELNCILNFDLGGLSDDDVQNIKQCSENVFQVLDYLSRWLQQKNGMVAAYASRNPRAMHIPPGFDPEKEKLQISRVEQILAAIPPRVIATRAAECKSFSRAVFHYEEDMRQLEKDDVDTQLKQLQAVYEQINEPDAIEGISARLRTINLSQQVLDHKRSGRWAAALSWYEIAVQEKPNDVKTHIDLLSCLKASSQYDSLLNAVQSHTDQNPDYYNAVVPFAAEAAWVTGRYEILERIMSNDGASTSQDFNAGVAKALLALRDDDLMLFNVELSELRGSVSRSFSPSATLSLSTCHSHLLKLHVLYELDMLSGARKDTVNAKDIMWSLDRRLDIIGSFTEDKQYILGVRRAVMELSKYDSITMQHIGSLWLTSSRLSRRATQIDSAHDAVLRAANLDDPAAKIEHARLLWKGGYSRKAIQSLQAALSDGSLLKQNFSLTMNSVTKSTGASKGPQNLLMAKGQLLLAKWMDLGGQEKSITVLERYKEVSKLNSASDKGHYFLGSYYNKILDSEKAAPENMQSSNYLSGECTKLVIDNYLRSMYFGPKYLYRTVPKVLTLWLDLGQEIAESKRKTQSGRKSDRKREDLEEGWLKAKTKSMDKINDQVKKYLVTRLPAYVPYTSFAQILSRINNPHKEISSLLTEVIERIVTQYPRQALWSLYAVSRSSVEEKKKIARDLLRRLVQNKKQPQVASIVVSGEVLTDCLLDVCQRPIEGRGILSLSKNLQFKRSLDEQFGLVVPFQKTLMATLPATTGNNAMLKNKPFPYNNVTVSGFLDEVLVLSSLQKPRKLIIRGSDGQKYPILCKPRDDLRKDQRLMEFNAMIDRALKRDVDASKRKLYIKTYAVTTLNDEHGVLEWVDGLRPLRDVIINHLGRAGIKLAFNDIRALLDKACRDPNGDKLFTEKLLVDYPPVLYKWFIETFPEPDTWFNARLQYTRSCGVMSIVGNALGLGDRHGENISLELGSGGVFHVDFNCLFEKGLTFDKPERVPFRLTHNMVDAFGAYGHEGPFRFAAEITQRILKQHEETLMTIMEAFLYDPTTDFGLEKRRRVPGVPDTPAEVLESVKAKFNCLLKDETVPLSVEGYVDALIRAATDPKNLVQMYVGWCPFL